MPTFTSFHLPAIAGLPIVTVPLGYYPEGSPVKMNPKGNLVQAAPGIPFGLAFIGRKWSEETLISLAYAFEQRTQVRRRQEPLVRATWELEMQLGDAVNPVSPSPSDVSQNRVVFRTGRRHSIVRAMTSYLVSWLSASVGLGRLASNSFY